MGTIWCMKEITADERRVKSQDTGPIAQPSLVLTETVFEMKVTL